MSADERMERLPKWAQQEINRLTRDLATVREAVARLAPTDSTAVVTDPYGQRGGTVGVAPRGEYVRFLLNQYDWLDVRVRYDGSGFDVMGSTTLHIACQASNTVGIEVRRA